jgi:hypothetical protein
MDGCGKSDSEIKILGLWGGRISGFLKQPSHPSNS